MYLVALIGKEKESLGQISALVNRFEAEKIILVKDKSVEEFPQNENCEIVEINSDKDLFTLRDEIEIKLKKYLSSQFEVALSIASGNGKEHMAVLSALLRIPVGVRIVAFTKNGVEYLS